MKPAKIVWWGRWGASAGGGGLWGVWVGMMVKEHNRVLAFGGARLEVVPVEEVWEAGEEGEEISLGYMSLWLEPNEIESVEVENDIIQIINLSLKDGLRFTFFQPNEFTVEEAMRDPDNTGTRQEIEEALRWLSFEGKKEGYYMPALTNLEYVWLDKKEREAYLFYLLCKSDLFNEKGIIIFEAPQVKGIFRRGRRGDSRMDGEIFSKDSRIQQMILVRNDKRVMEAEQEAKIKRILGSMRYLVEALPGEGELEAMVGEAVGKLKNDK